MLKLSLIIPVYNEERHIRNCLDAVAAQTDMPDEVIVVDNNSTDKTIEIAKSYDFVTVVVETKQGRGHARSAGFNAAKHEILGRIDADSRIAVDWVARVRKRFSEDQELDGLAGIGYTVFLPGINFVRSTIFTRSYLWSAHAQFNTITMWGANMAIRKPSWIQARDKVCLDDSRVHEDQDISLWMAAAGAKIMVDNRLRITTNGQGYRYAPKLLHYTYLQMITKRMHRQNGNLKSPKLRRLGFWNTLPGRLYALPGSVYIFVVAVVLFPIDYPVHRIWPKSWWLD